MHGIPSSSSRRHPLCLCVAIGSVAYINPGRASSQLSRTDSGPGMTSEVLAAPSGIVQHDEDTTIAQLSRPESNEVQANLKFEMRLLQD